MEVNNTPNRLKVPISDPYITEEDVLAVSEALRNKRLSQGEYVRRFEESFAEYIGVKHAVAHRRCR